ncbi:MAG: hypothetical protein ABS948_11890 [Solibacillus sp.]
MAHKKAFKDFVEQDVTTVFINVNEFGEQATVNGVMMDVVPVLDSLKEKSVDKKLAECAIVFNVAAANFEHIPIPERYMKYNEEEYKIEVVHNRVGMLTIGLSRNDS